MPKKQPDIEDEVTKALARVNVVLPDVLIINDNEAYGTAAVVLRDIASKRKELDKERKAITEPLDLSKKRVMALFKPVLDNLESRENEIRRAMTQYNAVLAARQREEQARLRDEQQRLEAKAKEEAKALLEDGNRFEAMAVLNNVPVVPTLVVDRPAVAGIGTRQNWKHRVVDILELMVHYADNPNSDLIIPNDKVLGEIARSTRGKVSIPGVEFYAEDGLVVK